jgi:hypothetical protein
MTKRAAIRVAVEAAPKNVFVYALDWPGWARAGKDEGLAAEALLAAAPRYALVAERAGLAFEADHLDLDVVERLAGGGGTEFGVPSTTAEADRLPVTAGEAARLAALVEAAWAAFDEIAVAAPEELRKGPRGGGRDRTKIVDHVNGADVAYAHEIGLRHTAVDRAAVEAMRAAMLEVLGAPSDGSPLAGRKWTQRYSARRIAWHALDHAWEIEDRTEPS